MPRRRHTPAEAAWRTTRPFLPSWTALRKLSRKQWLYLPRLFSREERLRLIILAAVAVTAFTLLAGRVIRRVTVERPAVGGTLREGLTGEPRFVNPLYASSDTDRSITSLVFSPLLHYGLDGERELDLAERLEISPDGKAYRVSLRPGASWHDGKPVSADDVVFTIRAIQDPAYQSPLSQNWRGVLVEKLDDLTVRFSLRQPYAPFTENLAVGILPEHLWKRIPRESAALSDLNLKPVGSGPYRFSKFSRREDGAVTSFVLSRNRSYYREGPYLKEIRLSFYADEDELVAAYRRNDIDAFSFLASARLPELRRLDLNTHELKPPKIFAVFLNAAVNPALGRKAVRQAMAMAIDRDALLASAGSGGTIVSAAIPPGVLGFNADIPAISYQPEEARRRLLDDNWKDRDNDGVLERVEGSGRRRKTERLEIEIATSEAPELKAAADAIAAMWNAIGVRANVAALPVSELESAMIRPRAYQALVFGEVFGHNPDPFPFWHTSQLKDPGLNIAMYSNRAVDELLEKARGAVDPGERETAYREFQRIVSDDVGAIFLYQPMSYYAIRKDTQGVAFGTASLSEERYSAVNLWYRDTRRVFK